MSQQDQEQEQEMEMEDAYVDMTNYRLPQMTQADKKSISDFLAYISKPPAQRQRRQQMPPAQRQRQQQMPPAQRQRRQQMPAAQMHLTFYPPISAPVQSCSNSRCAISGKKCSEVYGAECGGPWMPGDPMASQGSYGLVRYATMEGSHKLYIIKELNDTEGRVRNEVNLQIRAAEANIAPPVLQFMIHGISGDRMRASIIMPGLKRQ
jgi:hypothetical protein